jgi:hypothetical protein
MCTPGIHIKLCTCAEEQIDEKRCWRLARANPDPEHFTVGSIEWNSESFDGVESYLREKILEDINNTTVFDFKYAPLEGDLLTLTYGEYEFAFEFTDGKFVDAPIDYGFSSWLDFAGGNISLDREDPPEALS